MPRLVARPRRRPGRVTRRDEAIDAAERVLEREGLAAVTMRRLADELGIRAPSLYKHLAGKGEILTALQDRALARLAAALAGADGDLGALAGAYRQWALAHPRLYELSARYPLDRDHLTPGVEDAAAAPLIRAAGGNTAAARALWGLAHGLVDLELAGRFPPGADIAAAWEYAISALGGLLPPAEPPAG
ncbi:MAG TPA: TetR/AcrR family transcriptional regulator [Streptosporangiaceae bacterium]|nr:TetR/AcrR family transcriptional regulator [Streptosporangiaceae bacterium]